MWNCLDHVDNARNQGAKEPAGFVAGLTESESMHAERQADHLLAVVLSEGTRKLLRLLCCVSSYVTKSVKVRLRV